MENGNFPYPMESSEDEQPPPKILELLVKNFSKRPEDKLSENEIETLREYRDQLHKSTWEQWKKIGKEERSRRKGRHKQSHSRAEEEPSKPKATTGTEAHTPAQKYSQGSSRTTTRSPPPPPPAPTTWTTTRANDSPEGVEVVHQISNNSTDRDVPRAMSGGQYSVDSGQDQDAGQEPSSVPRSRTSPKKERMEQRRHLYEATKNPHKYFSSSFQTSPEGDTTSTGAQSEPGSYLDRQETVDTVGNSTKGSMYNAFSEIDSDETQSIVEGQWSKRNDLDLADDTKFHLNHSDLEHSRSSNKASDGIAFNKSKSAQQGRSRSVARGRGMKRPDKDADTSERTNKTAQEDRTVFYRDNASDAASNADSFVEQSSAWLTEAESGVQRQTHETQTQSFGTRTKNAFPVAPGAHAAISYEKTTQRPPPVLTKYSQEDDGGALSHGDRGDTRSQASGTEHSQRSHASDVSEQGMSPQSPGSSVSQQRKQREFVKKNIRLVDSGAYRNRRPSQSHQKGSSPHSSPATEDGGRGRRGSQASMLSEESMSAAVNRLYVSETAATKHRREAQEKAARRRASIHEDEDLGRAQWIVGLREEMEKNKESDWNEGKLVSDREQRRSSSVRQDRSRTDHAVHSEGKSVSRRERKRSSVAGQDRTQTEDHAQSNVEKVTRKKVPDEVYSSEYLTDLARVARTIREGFGPRAEVGKDPQSSKLGTEQSAIIPEGSSASRLQFSGLKLNDHGSMLLDHLRSTIRKARLSYNSLREEALGTLQTHMKELANTKALLAHRGLLCSSAYQEKDDWFGLTNHDDFVVSVESLNRLSYSSSRPNQLNLSTWILLMDASLHYQERRNSTFSLEAMDKGITCIVDGVSRTTFSDQTIDESTDTTWSRACGIELANDVFHYGGAVFMLNGPRRQDKLRCLLGDSQNSSPSLFGSTLHALHNRIERRNMELRMNAVSINNQGLFDLLHPDFAATTSPRQHRKFPPKVEIADERGIPRLQSATSVRITSSDDIDILERVMYRRLRSEAHSSEMWHAVSDVADRYSHTLLVIDVLTDGSEGQSHKIAYRLCLVLFADGARIDSSLLSNLLRSARFSQPEEAAALTKVENAHKWAQQEKVSFIRALEAWKNSIGDRGKKGVVSRASTLCSLLGKTLNKSHGKLTICEALPGYFQSQTHESFNRKSSEQLLDAADTNDVDFELRFVEEINNMKGRT